MLSKLRVFNRTHSTRHSLYNISCQTRKSPISYVFFVILLLLQGFVSSLSPEVSPLEPKWPTAKNIARHLLCTRLVRTPRTPPSDVVLYTAVYLYMNHIGDAQIDRTTITSSRKYTSSMSCRGHGGGGGCELNVRFVHAPSAKRLSPVYHRMKGQHRKAENFTPQPRSHAQPPT